MKKADIGLIGLAVMGENLIMNMESKGFTVACFNRTVEKVDNFVNGRAKGKNIIGCHSIQELADRAISSSTAATATSQTRSGARSTWSPRDFSTSARGFPAARRVRLRDPR